MNMPQDKSTSLHDPSTPTVAQLAGTAGPDGPTAPRDVTGHLQAGRFFWLDLETQATMSCASSARVSSCPRARSRA
jgi:hypothetical protein